MSNFLPDPFYKDDNAKEDNQELDKDNFKDFKDNKKYIYLEAIKEEDDPNKEVLFINSILEQINTRL